MEVHHIPRVRNNKSHQRIVILTTMSFQPSHPQPFTPEEAAQLDVGTIVAGESPFVYCLLAVCVSSGQCLTLLSFTSYRPPRLAFLLHLMLSSTPLSHVTVPGATAPLSLLHNSGLTRTRSLELPSSRAASFLSVDGADSRNRAVAELAHPPRIDPD